MLDKKIHNTVATSAVVARADVLAGLGLTPSAQQMAGTHVGEAIPADPTGGTSLPGVSVAGHVTDLGAQVISAATAGLAAGLGAGARTTFGGQAAVDEPQYLLTALSRWEDHSLDISDELADRRIA